MDETRKIYLDYAATTPVDPEVAKLMFGCLTIDGNFGNPASRTHSFGWKAEEAVECARAQVADLLGCSSREIIFTSGATESNNIAIKGVAEFNVNKGKHIVTMKTEHKAVLDTVREMERRGWDATYLTPNSDGLLDFEAFNQSLRPDTTIVSIMHANNETGVIQDIKKIGEICRQKGIIYHVDASQSAGKIPISVDDQNIDLLSLSGHKIYGPKGIGILYVRRKPKVRLISQMHGGGHEFGIRSGTLPTHQIVGLGKACEIAKEIMNSEALRISRLRDILEKELLKIPEVSVNGSRAHRLPGHLNISFSYVEGESLLMSLQGIAVSSGSACTSASLEPSYVLRALGLSDELAHSSLRIAVGKYTTEDEINFVITKIKESVQRLREMSPLWEMHLDGVDVENYDWTKQAH
ncbi:MAG: IscS subfamily cysteine desulfurase [Methylacidiphilales bacterium]|nr:IscS subfamily cysteine desulfurase [Candidatus Methylacidiphilales bacterium]